MTNDNPVAQPNGVEVPAMITAGPCSQCGAMVVGLNACPYCGSSWIGNRVGYTRATPDPFITEKARRVADALNLGNWLLADATESEMESITAIIAAEFQK